MKRISFILISLLFVSNLFCATTKITYNGSGNYELVERTDLRRYDNGRYTGLVSREVSSFIIPISSENGYLYDGTFYIDEKTIRNMRNAGISVNDEIPSVFKIDDKGKLSMITDNGFPSYRSFPSFPDTPITIGSKWQAKAERAIDPLNKGIVTRLPIVVEYTYIRDGEYYGEDVYVINAKWATRYGFGTGSYYKDWGGDESLERASGTHNATIYVSKTSGNSLLIQDNLDETYLYDDGNQIRFKGTVSLFTKYPPSIDRKTLIPTIKRIANLSDEEADALMDKDNITQTDILDYSSLIAINDESINKGSSGISSNDDVLWEAIDGSISSLDGYGAIGYSSNNNDGFTGSSGVSGNGFTNKEEIEQKIKDNISTSDKEDKKINIKVANTTAGLRLTIHNLQFLPDSSELLPGQTQKLEEIAELLKTLPNGRFLIEGHTASTGYEKGEMKLSLERAQSIANEFIKRGLKDNQFIIRGSGGKKPIADNSTRDGKALNRRVEITILE